MEKKTFESIHEAAKAGALEAVKGFVETKGFDINTTEDRTKNTALHCAAENGRLAVVNYLLKKDANILAEDADGSTALGLAKNQEESDNINQIIKLLEVEEKNAREKKEEEESKGSKSELLLNILSPNEELKRAIQKNSPKLIKDLIQKYGENLDLKTTDGISDRMNKAIHIAVWWKDKELVQELINLKVDLTAQDVHGYTPLHIACKVGSAEIAELLIRNLKDKSSINARSNGFIGYNNKKIEGVTPFSFVKYSKDPHFIALMEYLDEHEGNIEGFSYTPSAKQPSPQVSRNNSAIKLGDSASGKSNSREEQVQPDSKGSLGKRGSGAKLVGMEEDGTKKKGIHTVSRRSSASNLQASSFDKAANEFASVTVDLLIKQRNAKLNKKQETDLKSKIEEVLLEQFKDSKKALETLNKHNKDGYTDKTNSRNNISQNIYSSQLVDLLIDKKVYQKSRFSVKLDFAKVGLAIGSWINCVKIAQRDLFSSRASKQIGL